MVSFELGKKNRDECFFVLSRAWDIEKIPSPHEESNIRPSVLWRPFSLERSVSWRDEKNIFFYILRYFDFYVFLLSTNLVSCLFFHFLAINHFFISTFLFRPATQIWYFGLFPFAWNQDIIICCCNSSFLNFDTFVFVVLGEFGVLPCFHYLWTDHKMSCSKELKVEYVFPL